MNRRRNPYRRYEEFENGGAKTTPFLVPALKAARRHWTELLPKNAKVTVVRNADGLTETVTVEP